MLAITAYLIFTKLKLWLCVFACGCDFVPQALQLFASRHHDAKAGYPAAQQRIAFGLRHRQQAFDI